MRNLILLILFATPHIAAAQDWAIRDSDRVLSREEVVALTSGQTLVFFDDGRSKYSAGGSYSYTYASGENAFGRYEVDEEGTVCVLFRNGFSRCDRYVADGDRIVLLDARGQRYPVKER